MFNAPTRPRPNAVATSTDTGLRKLYADGPIAGKAPVQAVPFRRFGTTWASAEPADSGIEPRVRVTAAARDVLDLRARDAYDLDIS